jgi:hypothetical protein
LAGDLTIWSSPELGRRNFFAQPKKTSRTDRRAEVSILNVTFVLYQRNQSNVSTITCGLQVIAAAGHCRASRKSNAPGVRIAALLCFFMKSSIKNKFRWKTLYPPLFIRLAAAARASSVIVAPDREGLPGVKPNRSLCHLG